MFVLQALLLLSVLTSLAGIIWLIALRAEDGSRSKAVENRIWWATALACAGVLGMVLTIAISLF